MMRILKIILITLAINGLLLPFYGLDTVESIGDILGVTTIGLREMFIPTCYIAAVYFLMSRLSGNWFQKRSWRIVFGIFLLICISLLSEIAWSAIVAKDSVNHFAGFWGFYFLWTILSCILIPLLDRFLSKEK